MPIWVSFYVAVMLLSLPFGALMLRRIERDWLHPVGGVISTLLSVAFVISYWLPETVPFQSRSTLLLFGFVLFWDFYSLQRIRRKLPQLFERPFDSQADDQPDQDSQRPPQLDAASLFAGLAMMAPAYIFGVLVCLRALQ